MGDIQGRCAGCGLLAVWNGGENRHLEVDSHYRTTGEASGLLAHADGVLECVARAADLQRERVDSRDDDPDPRRRILLVIGKDRNCPKFVAHQPGRSPKEHADMLAAIDTARVQAESHKSDMDRAERQFEKQLARQSDEADRQRAWQERESAKQRRWQAGRERVQRQAATNLEKRKLRAEWARLIATGVATALFSLAAFLGGRWFEKAEKPSPASAGQIPAASPK